VKIKKSFLQCLLLLVPLMLHFHCDAQITDSIKHDNGFLYFQEYGAKDLPVVMLLTGGPGNSYIQLDAMAKTLSTKFRCILPEQRGTGKSIPNPFDSTTISVDLITRDIKNLMDSLRLSKVILIGHSWGGMLAMNFASLFPKRVEHLVLIAPGPHKDVKNGFDVLYANRSHTRSFDEEERLIKLIALMDKKEADLSEVLEASRLERRAYIYANPIPDSIFTLINADRNRKTFEIILNELFRNFNLSKSLQNYKGKVDIIAGRQDVVGFFSYELKLDRPAANLYWINKCGHFPMYEKPDWFYKILFEILTEK
jgi:proline iminopeptidase